MARDYISEARAIADASDHPAFADVASAIRDAINYSSTGGELLTQLRFHLRRVADISTIPEVLGLRASSLADDIDAALRGC